MTEEQFEALKAWIRAMRDADRAFAATDWGNNEARSRVEQ